MYDYDPSIELYHHGIKGQKWGVRNGPPYPIEDKVLPKGTVLRSVSSKHLDARNKLDTKQWIYTYNPDNEWDNKVYKGPFSTYLVQYRGAQFIAEHEYETVRDLKMPTKKERIQEFKDLYNDKRYNKKVRKELASIQSTMKKYQVGSPESQKVNLKNLKTDADFKAAYEVFNHAMEASNRFKSTSEYSKRISDKYDAMVDDNNQGIYNDAQDPVIIFKTTDLIARNAGMPVKMLTASEIVENTDYVRDELAKSGKRVKL